ncbi:MAG: AMP-binding protein [Chitinivibrionia bacterium]|nr:AMP-binding protein [Chitinivibrionia bacterium]
MLKDYISIANKPYPMYERELIYDLKGLVEYASKKHGENNAFTFDDDDEKEANISFNRFKREIDALGASFYEKDIKNDRIVLLGESSYLWILSYFAGVNGGSAMVPLDKNLSAEALEVLIKDSEAGVLIYSDTFADIAEKIKSDKLRVKLNMKTDILQMIEAGKELVAKEAPSAKEFIDYKIDPHNLAVIIYTSGTTGISKGVMLSHKNLATDIIVVLSIAQIQGRELMVLPLNHAFAFTACILCAIYMGCDIVINKSLKNVLNDMKKFKPDCTLLVPLFVETFYKKIWQNAAKSGKEKLLKKVIKISNFLLKHNIDLRRKLFKSVHEAFGGNLGLIVTGGAPIDEKYMQGFREFGINIINGYGITECSPIVAVNRNLFYREGSVGMIVPNTKVRIWEPDENGIGEVCVRGDIVMMGYYNNPEATKEAFFEVGAEKWFRTGDIGKIDGDNFLFICGRKKNLIILSNGENVSPEGLEQEILNEFVYVKEVVCFQEDNAIVAEAFFNKEYIEETGTQDVDYGDKFQKEILEFNRKQPPQKNIAKVLVRLTEFPKTTTQKIKRNYK